MRREKIQAIMVLFISTLLLTIVFSCTLATAEMQKPNFKKGQHWNYYVKYFKGNTSYNGTSSFQVISKENMSFNKTQLKVFKCSETVKIPEYYNLTINTSLYILPLDNSLKKVVSKISSDRITNKTRRIYEGLGFRGIQWPLKKNKTWINNITQDITYFEEDNEINTKNNLSFKYKCLNKKILTINKSIYECYKIKKWGYNDDQNKNYTISYYSPEVGGRYVQRKVFSNGNLTWMYNLTDYNFTQKKDSENKIYSKNSLDFFSNFILIIIIMIVAVTVVLLFIKKFK